MLDLLMTLGKVDLPVEDFGQAIPLLWVTALGGFILVVDLLLTDRVLKGFLGWVTALGLLFAIAFNSVNPVVQGETTNLFHGAYRVDWFTYYANILILISVLLSVLTSLMYLRSHDLLQGEFFGLLLFATSGMMLMVGASDLIIFFLGFEIMSLAAYILVAWTRQNLYSGEGSLKYLISGAFATAILAFGIVLVFGQSGSFQFQEIAAYVMEDGGATNPVFLAGFGLITGGFAFKVSAVPFHMWAPDAYRGAPLPITGFLSTGVKVAAFLGFLRLFLGILPADLASWTTLLAVLATLSVIVGNVAAVATRNIKAMLAYSGIAHAGYVLIGMTAMSSSRLTAGGQAGEAVLYYLLVYTFMNLGAFACVIYAGKKNQERILLSEFRGLVSDHPWLSTAFALFLISLTGLPPTGGFLGKIKIFEAAFSSGHTWLVLVGVGGTLVSVYYYMRVVMIMFMREKEEDFHLSFSPGLVIVLFVAVWGVLYLGISPGVVSELATRSFRALLETAIITG